MARLEGAYEQISGRLDSMDCRLSSIDGRLNAIDARIDGLDQKIDVRFNLLAGMLATSWVTIVLTILFHR